VLWILNSTSSAEIAYHISQCKWLPESEDKAMHIAIIDFGDSGMSIAIIKLWQGAVEVTALCCDIHFAG
jgi:NADPH-dependent glutamate synthase beta subunit-like oxidoreductase